MAPTARRRCRRPRARDRLPPAARGCGRPSSASLAAILDEGLEPQSLPSSGRASIRPTAVVNAEPGVDEDALGGAGGTPAARVRRWPALHHYFGGVSLVGRTGLAGDPRRSGAALAL